MQLEVKIDPAYDEPKILVLTASVTEELQHLLNQLADHAPQIITGRKEEKVEILAPADLIRIYAGAGKVFAVTDRGEYTLRLRLYELESRLDPQQFIRISNAEIINLRQVRHFDLSLTGTICVKLSDGTTTYVSRRYVATIKKRLGI